MTATDLAFQWNRVITDSGGTSRPPMNVINERENPSVMAGFFVCTKGKEAQRGVINLWQKTDRRIEI